MKLKRFLGALSAALMIVIVILILAPCTLAASNYKVLHSFTGVDGQETMGRLLLDAAGNLYGMTTYGGAYGEGTVFELTPNANGTWTESVLYSFTGGTDGAEPLWSGLAFDSAGNLYGTTEYGGSGYGVVFELSNLDGTWTENVLYSFSGGGDGAYPITVPAFDQSGNLYASTSAGGTHGEGTVFQLTPGADGVWTEKVLHGFAGGDDGHSPWAGLVFDTAGYLYGTTRGGGRSGCSPDSGCGTVFQLAPGQGDKWTYRVLHRFTGGKGGFDPSIAGMVFDTAGTLYGSTEYGGIGDCVYYGNSGCGTIFKMTPVADNKWNYGVVYHFRGGKAGGDPFRVIFDAAGTLYGTTVEGGIPGCDQECGTVFKLSPTSGGLGRANSQGWHESVLHGFKGFAGNPDTGLVLDSAGNIYGTARYGGAHGAGVVFEITP